ncbi:MAG TPA: glycosyltransferase, partial [Blastocatellia bacterium]|nr:glycosyltransferase [Blastocatellia bacterium]
ELHSPVDPSDPVFDAVFIGTYEPLRGKTLAALKDLNIGIWGNGWDRSTQVPKGWIKGKAIYGKQAALAMSHGCVNINILRSQNANSHNMRTFEIPATGNLMLTTRSQEQQEFLIEDTDVLMYGSPEELVEKVKWAVQNQGLALKLGARGLNRVRPETYRKRAEQILDFCGIR